MLKNQLCLRWLTRQRRVEWLLELNNAVPVTAGRGHWKAVDIISFLVLQSYIYCLPRLFLNTVSSSRFVYSRNFVKEIKTSFFFLFSGPL